MSHILIIEDELGMSNSLVKGLSKAGFLTTVINNGLVARSVNINEFDLILLDWMLPGISGIELLNYWRSQHLQTPIIMLTAKNTVADKVNGLDFGADDYISKFFEWPELLARINALLRRITTQVIEVGGIKYDKVNQQFSENDRLIDLTATEHNILKYFFERPNRLITRTSLVRALYDQAHNPFSNVIERHIRSIRQKFSYDPIQTTRGLGYRLNTNQTIPNHKD